jgi:serine/threonine-protein kinase RsbW/stage II sporulation protein AB (anti-sigma F factor)
MDDSTLDMDDSPVPVPAPDGLTDPARLGWQTRPGTGERLQTTALAQPPAVGELRCELANYATSLGASELARDAIAVAVSEVVTNAVVHAYPGQDPGPIMVEAWGDGQGHLFVLISDAGTGMMPRPDSPGLGLGMPLMAVMADDVHVTSRGGLAGTMVSMSFSLDGSGASVPADDTAGYPPLAIPRSKVREPIRIVEKTHGRRRVLMLYGELDLATAPQFEERLHGGGDIVVDLAGLSFIDSTGIRLLITTAKQARGAGLLFEVRNPQPAARRLIQLAGVDQLLGLTANPTPQAAQEPGSAQRPPD